MTIVEPGGSYSGPQTGSVMRSEYERFNAVSLGWRLAELNCDYSFSPTYPDLLGVPATVDDQLLRGAALKTLYGVPLDGASLLSLASQYLAAMNTPGVVPR